MLVVGMNDIPHAREETAINISLPMDIRNGSAVLVHDVLLDSAMLSGLEGGTMHFVPR